VHVSRQLESFIKGDEINWREIGLERRLVKKFLLDTFLHGDDTCLKDKSCAKVGCNNDALQALISRERASSITLNVSSLGACRAMVQETSWDSSRRFSVPCERLSTVVSTFVEHYGAFSGES
jgi:hypothetical protein